MSTKPNENVQAEDKQCKTLSPGSEPPDSNSTHQDELARIAPSVSSELDISPNVAAYENDFNFDDWEGSSDGCDCDQFTAIMCHQKWHFKAWRKQEL